MAISLEEFSDRLLELFPKLARDITGYENNYLTRGMITVPQLWVMDYLSRRKYAHMGEVARFMKMSCPSATGLADRLVKQGLVARKRCSTDRRAIYVSISAKGIKILKEIYRHKRKGIMKVFRPLNARERAVYLKIIDKIILALSVVDPE